MSVNGELRDEMINLYNQHKDCDAEPYPCSVGDEFMDYMNGWINQ